MTRRSLIAVTFVAFCQVTMGSFLASAWSAESETSERSPVFQIRDRTTQPLLTADKPWEAMSIGFCTVIREGNRWRMWYVAYDHNYKRDEDGCVCYAESPDGVQWTKPELGLVEYNGTKNNNILIYGPQVGGLVFSSVFIDEGKNPAERYKMIWQRFDEKPQTWGVYGATSADGIHWTLLPKPLSPKNSDTQTTCFADGGKYRLYTRMWRGGWSGVRTVGYAESDHFGDFSDPVEIFSHDEQDPAGMQFYTNAATKLGEQLYVMFPAAFYTKQQTVRDHLAWSRDGVHFTRYGRQPVVDLGAGFDSRSIYVAPGSVPSDAPNTWWFYYFASKEEHDTDAANIHSAGGIGRFLLAVDEPPVNADALKPMIEIKWRLGPDYPMGIQDSAVGMIHGKLISAGGFTRHPKDIVKQYPDAFGGEPSGFTKLAFALDPKDESAGWKRIADLPGPARQGMSVAVVDNRFYVMGGINYTEPLTYRDTYRLQEKDGRYDWEKLETCQLPWPVYGASAGTAVIGEKIYLFGAADYFKSPGTDGADFHSEGGRADSPVGKALLVLDTTNLGAGWKRLADCPGVPTFDTAFAAAGGKLYRLSGIFGPLSKSELSYYNAVDSWMYDPAADTWTRLRDMPHGCNQRALVYADRYIVLVTRFVYSKTRNPDGSATDVYDPKKITPPFEKTVQVYDIVTGQLGTATPLLEQTCFPGAAVDGDTLYCLGGEGGPRLYHPATLQIGKVLNVIPR